MKIRFALIVSFLLVAAASSAADPEPKQKPHPAFDRLKKLVGTWQTDAKGTRVTTVFRVVANGSAIEEHLMPETASMINMIHPDGDGMMMTHYCAGANQPRYKASGFEGNTIVFSFADGTNIGDSYMSGVTLRLVDDDHLRQEWTNTTKGKQESFAFDFVRVK